ncbi:hypothetical protein PVAP13_9NG299346 [Panicum virgatum]|uniref:Uncharacterized protein n=1 Tax=Panicum virgatum TaxID=38727 RepID=A0A8T0MK87_PANVG|nr:hypothetical protein PVAP13_9NG299346 [Panicum virgatum]
MLPTPKAQTTVGNGVNPPRTGTATQRPEGTTTSLHIHRQTRVAGRRGSHFLLRLLFQKRRRRCAKAPSSSSHLPPLAEDDYLPARARQHARRRRRRRRRRGGGEEGGGRIRSSPAGVRLPSLPRPQRQPGGSRPPRRQSGEARGRCGGAVPGVRAAVGGAREGGPPADLLDWLGLVGGGGGGVARLRRRLARGSEREREGGRISR